MNAATKEALLESIEHWRKNESIQKIEDAKLGPRHCALCVMFLHTGCSLIKEGQLEICPVYDSTNHKCCKSTPYIEAEDAHANNDIDAFLKAAKQEREFLESLLPAKKRKGEKIMTVINLNEKRQPVKFTIHITANYDGTFETLVENVSDSPESRNAVCDILVRLAETYLNKKVEAAADDMLTIMLANIDHAMNLTEENPAVFKVTAQELSTWAEAVVKYESQRFGFRE